MNRAAGLWRAALLVAALGACTGNELNGPGRAVSITFDLETPNEDDGALALVVRGGPVDSVKAAGTGKLRVYAASAHTDQLKVVVTGAIGAGPLLVVYVPDAGLAAAYTAVVTDAAARTSYELRDASAYQLVPR